ncbi:uncharacterized protein LOC121727863 [Aricia agestis]|uniref:uncharacterized protein LOC121727863 n=1 Tax=Aricia agestis TaxID=91739 RepID=UPI001C20570A|nr:uncharacterized protein LOC121727863 [Aricia agestis]XP_041971838.1 uncharacterized protein LOC121727863 [Aricia agestis]XP_041971839.1 uncharacterized protein LOC121727863 [Aricia agestis]
MGQEQSYNSTYSNVSVKRYSERYEDPVQYRVNRNYQTSERDSEYRRYRARRSADSSRSDNSSTESSGYRSGSSSYERDSDASYKSDYYSPSLYKNKHYKGINKELYKPVKIPKEKQYKVILFDDKPEIKSARLKSYLCETSKEKYQTDTLTPMKSGIRNYTPKIISAEDHIKNTEH